MAMRLRHIEVFRAVMLAGTASDAARMLGVSQPVVSRTLQHAELSLGYPLFDRSRGRLVPTREARALFGEVDRLFDEMDRVRRFAANLNRDGDGHLRVAATPSIAQSLVPAALARLRERHPRASIALRTEHTDRIVHALLTHDVDIGFAIDPPRHEAIVAETVGTGTMVLASPCGWFGHAEAALPFVAMLSRPMVALDDQTPLGLLVREALARRGHVPAVAATVQTYSLARALVEEGLGFAFLDEFTAAAGDPARVECHRLAEPIPFGILALRARHRPSSVLADALAEGFGESIRRLAGAGRSRWRPDAVDLGAPAASR
jgi:DNA-binding transcriptional LysR family regulator